MMVPANTFAEFSTLAQFVGDLRSRVFKTKKRAADYFGLHHTTIGRYEDDNPTTHSTPPLGYVATLAQMAIEQLRQEPHQDERIRRELLDKLNAAITLCYPGQARLRTWADVVQCAVAYHQPPADLPNGETFTHPRQEDWGTAPDTAHFLGRMDTLTELMEWVRTARCRVVGIVGMAGVGKTWLAAVLVRRVLPDFSHMLWRSLQNAPPLPEILADCIRLLADQKIIELPGALDQQLTLLLNLLRTKRCLLVFDNVESILAAETPASRYRPGYESYGLLFRALTESEHQSCLLFTSREEPPHLAHWQGQLGPVRLWRLTGLALPAVRQLLAKAGLSGSERAWRQLTNHYSGNPLALRLAAIVVQEQYAGNLHKFLEDNIAIFGEMRDLLDQQFQRLSPREQAILCWLAVLREPTAHVQLSSVMLPAASRIDLIESLQSLLRRCWVEVYAARFGLQNVILEYMTARLVCAVSDAILTQSVAHLERCALLLASSPDYICAMQRRLLLQPTAQQLIAHAGVEGARNALLHLKSNLQQTPGRYVGYAGANLFHLLAQLNDGNLAGQDFSQLTIRQAFLREVELRNATFAQATLIDCVLAEAFGVIDAVAFSPDGRWLAVGADNDTLHLWRLGQEDDHETAQAESYRLEHVRRFEARTIATNTNLQINRQQRIRVLAFHPQGHLLAAGYENGAISIWNTLNGRRLATIVGHRKQLLALRFDTTAGMLYSACVDQTICHWETTHWHCVETWQGGAVRAKAIAFSPVASLLAIGVRNTVQLWDRAQRHCQAIFQHEQATEVLSVAFSPDGALLVSGEYQGGLALWEVHTGRCRWRAAANIHEVRAVAFAPDGRLLVSASHDGFIRLWDIMNGACVQLVDVQDNGLFALAFHPAGRILAGGSHEGSVRLWAVTTHTRPKADGGRCLTTRQGWPRSIWGIALAQDHRRKDNLLLHGGDDGRIQLWQWPQGVLHKVVIGHQRAIRALACALPTEATEQLLASGGLDMTVRLWRLPDGACRHVFHGHTGGVLALAFRPDGRVLASGGYDNTIRLWDVDTGECLATLHDCQDTVRALAFSPDGARLAASGSDTIVRLWDAQTFAYQSDLQGHRGTVSALAFCPAAQTLASADHQCVRLWHLSSGQCVQVFEGCYPLAFDASGNLLFSLSKGHGRPQLIDWQSGQILRTYAGASGHLYALQVSADGQFLLGGGEEGLIRIWDCDSGELVRTLAPERIYEQMNMDGVRGLAVGQQATLRLLGAVGEPDPAPLRNTYTHRPIAFIQDLRTLGSPSPDTSGEGAGGEGVLRNSYL